MKPESQRKVDNGAEHDGKNVFGRIAHPGRTQPEAVLIVLEPDGVIASTTLLAFDESLDYLPPGRWLRQFDRKTLRPDLALGQEIVAITGATLSTSGVTDSVRRALAVYQVKLAPKKR